MGQQERGTDGDLSLLDNSGSNIFTISAADFGGDESSIFRNLTVNIINQSLAPFTIYPNPAQESITLEANSGLSKSYIITDLVGKCYSSGRVLLNKTTINTSLLSSGSYVLRLLNNDGTTDYKTFVIK